MRDLRADRSPDDVQQGNGEPQSHVFRERSSASSQRKRGRKASPVEPQGENAAWLSPGEQRGPGRVHTDIQPTEREMTGGHCQKPQVPSSL